MTEPTLPGKNEEIIHQLRGQLLEMASPEFKKSTQRFFREEVNIYGVKSPEVQKISKEYLKKLKLSHNKKGIFELCDMLWMSNYLEESIIAANWSYSCAEKFLPDDFKRFEYWVMNFVHNWASCDTLCNHTIGKFIELYPSFLSYLKVWALSENRWVRRASAVSLIIPAREGKFLKDIFEIAELLLMDKDDLVRKGYGWMLKAASQAHEMKVFDFIMEKKAVMPRTALRYAIEKMPERLRSRAMGK